MFVPGSRPSKNLVTASSLCPASLVSALTTSTIPVALSTRIRTARRTSRRQCGHGQCAAGSFLVSSTTRQARRGVTQIGALLVAPQTRIERPAGAAIAGRQWVADPCVPLLLGALLLMPVAKPPGIDQASRLLKALLHAFPRPVQRPFAARMEGAGLRLWRVGRPLTLPIDNREACGGLGMFFRQREEVFEEFVVPLRYRCFGFLGRRLLSDRPAC